MNTVSTIDAEQRSTERLLLSIPIRVIGIDRSSGDFSVDTSSTVVNRTGGRIFLKQDVAPGDTLRIVNLENYSEADFRVVGPTRLDPSDPSELGVECLEIDRNVWGIKFPPPFSPGTAGSGALLVCRACREQVLWQLTLTEIDVLDSAGQIPGDCSRCGKSTYWAYGDTSRLPRRFDPSEPVEPPLPVQEVIKKTEKRILKRLAIKMPVRVRTRSGQVEVTKTENLSKNGFAANLGLELSVGETVRVTCPYNPVGPNIEQDAEVRRRPISAFGGRRVYGFRILGK